MLCNLYACMCVCVELGEVSVKLRWVKMREMMRSIQAKVRSGFYCKPCDTLD